jgi:hypothetical protein
MNLQGQRLTTGNKKSPEKSDKLDIVKKESTIDTQESKRGCLLEGGACQKASFLPFRMLYTLPDREDITSQPSISQIDWQRSKRKAFTRFSHAHDAHE